MKGMRRSLARRVASRRRSYTLTSGSALVLKDASGVTLSMKKPTEVEAVANVPRCPYCSRTLVLEIANKANGRVYIELRCSKHGAVHDKWKNRLEPVKAPRR